ncbi:DUF3558 domain-containing protein [Nocardia macrotermitis]|uniref:DUF3558 domain-containing protein n=1 Tax=Nocardia macrotermitis TaxID=2585198 RepID=A0A7K0D1D1_9NOCA|nr:DUF3558 domain-containing protein [Nocardia macrotermitis]MQY19491.1 hypothetical protein [Nocardia macrotermitis]
MTDWGRVTRCAAVAIGATALLAGCNDSGGTSGANSSAAAPTSTIAASVPTAIDPCQLPQSVVTAEHLDRSDDQATEQDGDGGAKWRDCGWGAYEGDGYGLNVSVTNVTVPMVEANKKFTVTEHLTISGREAVTYHRADIADSHGECLIHLALKDGGLELTVTNPPERKATGNLDSCEIAKKLGKEIAQSIPATA